jgi:hypothetical protein
MQRKLNLTDILNNFFELDSQNQIENVVKTCLTIDDCTKTIKTSNIIRRETNILPVLFFESESENSHSENLNTSNFNY